MPEKLDSSPVPDFAEQIRLSGRVFVVLGAGNGIGRQVSHALAQAGAKVGCVDRDPDLAKHVANEIGGHPLTGDITQRHDVARLAQINRALQKIDEGTYGLSDISGERISTARLHALPEASTTLQEQQARE